MPWFIVVHYALIIGFDSMADAMSVLAEAEKLYALVRKKVLIPNDHGGFTLTRSTKLLKRATVVIYRWCIALVEATEDRIVTDEEILGCAPANKKVRLSWGWVGQLRRMGGNQVTGPGR